MTGGMPTGLRQDQPSSATADRVRPPFPAGTTPGLGLALGGGAVLGAAHVGVLKAMAERGLRPQVVVGTSIGALVGAAYASGMDVDDMESLVLASGWSQVGRLSLTPRFGVLDSTALADTLSVRGVAELIEDLPLRFGAMVTDMRARQGVVLSSGPLADALRASIAIPGLFPPVARDGMLLFDGGLAANLPIGAARELGADWTIAVRLRPEWGLVPVAGATEQAEAWEHDPATLVIRPDHRGLSMWSTSDVPRLIDAGRTAAEIALDEAERRGMPEMRLLASPCGLQEGGR